MSGATAGVPALIRAEMERRELTQQALAERLGWKQQRVSRRLTGAVAPTVGELFAIAAALDVPVTQLLGESVSS